MSQEADSVSNNNIIASPTKSINHIATASSDMFTLLKIFQHIRAPCKTNTRAAVIISASRSTTTSPSLLLLTLRTASRSSSSSTSHLHIHRNQRQTLRLLLLTHSLTHRQYPLIQQTHTASSMNHASLSSNHTTTTTGVANRSMASSMSLASAPTSSTSPTPSKKRKVIPRNTRNDTNQLIASVGLHPYILKEKYKLIPKGIRSRDKMEIAIYNIDGLPTHHQRNFIDRLTHPPLRSGKNQVYRNEDFRYAFAQMLVNVVNEHGLDHVRNQVVLRQAPPEGLSGGGAVAEENVSSAPSSDTHDTTNETSLVVRIGPSSAASSAYTASAARARVKQSAPTTSSNNSASSQSSSSKQSSGTKRKRSEAEENPYEWAIYTISMMRNAPTIERSRDIADLFFRMRRGDE